MALRIPQAKLTDALDMFKNMGRVRSQRLSGENITDVYYDTDARIRIFANKNKDFRNTADG